MDINNFTYGTDSNKIIEVVMIAMSTRHWCFPGGSDSKESVCNVGDLGLIPGLVRSPGGRYGNPLQYSCLENTYKWRSLVG